MIPSRRYRPNGLCDQMSSTPHEHGFHINLHVWVISHRSRARLISIFSDDRAFPLNWGVLRSLTGTKKNPTECVINFDDEGGTMFRWSERRIIRSTILCCLGGAPRGRRYLSVRARSWCPSKRTTSSPI